MRRLILCSALLLVPAVSSARVELTPFVGFGSGGVEYATGIVCVASPCPSFARSDDSLLFGAVGDFYWTPKLAVELLFHRQPTQLALADGPGFRTPAGLLPKADLDLTHLHVGLLRTFEVGSWTPFGAVGAGVSRVESGMFLPGRSAISRAAFVDEDSFSASLGAGAKRSLTDRIGLRLEARLYWMDLPSDIGGEATRAEATTGLAFRW